MEGGFISLGLYEKASNYLQTNLFTTIKDMSKNLGIYKSTAVYLLDLMMKNNVVEKININNKQVFIYKTDEGASILNQNIAIANIKSKEIKNDIMGLKEEMGKIYSNFISLMAIFTSIFSLVVVNSNILLNLPSENIIRYVCYVAILNISIIICFAILTVLINVLVMKNIVNR